MRNKTISSSIEHVLLIAEHDKAVAAKLRLALLKEVLEAVADGCEGAPTIARATMEVFRIKLDE